MGLSHRTPGCPRFIHLSPTSTDVGLTNGQTDVLHASRAEARQSTRATLTFRQFVTDSKERAPKRATPYPVPRQGQHPSKRGQLPAPQNHSISAHCELTPDSRHTPQSTGRKPHSAELETRGKPPDCLADTWRDSRQDVVSELVASLSSGPRGPQLCDRVSLAVVPDLTS